MKRIRVVPGRTVLVTAVVAVGLAGCSVLSPSVISTPYPAADGVGLALPGTNAALRNFLVVGTAKDAPAAVIGTVVNDGDSAVQVELQTDLGAGAQPTPTVIDVDPHASVRVGPDQEQQMVISALAVQPGAFTMISAATQAGGTADLSVPVLLPQGYYTGLTPSPVPTSDTPTPTPTDPSATSDVAGPTPTGTEATKASTKKNTKKNKNKAETTPTPTSS